MKHPVYTFFNIVYQLIAIWFLIIANAFLNIRIIPYNGYTFFKILLLFVEAAVVVVFINMMNRLALHDSEGKEGSIKIAGRTSKVNAIILLLLVGLIFRDIF
jgi:hypothetical protein